jgi:inosine-uridine nucleoside N-ribohydrolase
MRVVIDTDTGVDDAIAIMMALNCLPEGSVLGITTVFGNVELHQTNHNVA